MVWAAVDAARKPEDLFDWSEQLGGFDALAVTDLDHTVSPAAVLQCGIPVGRLEGRAGHAAAVGVAPRPPTGGLSPHEPGVRRNRPTPKTSPAGPAPGRRSTSGWRSSPPPGVPGCRPRVEDRRPNRLVVAVPQDPEQPAARRAVPPTGWRCAGPVPAASAWSKRACWPPPGPGSCRPGNSSAGASRRCSSAGATPGCPSCCRAGPPGRRGAWGLTILDVAEGGIRCLAPQLAPFDPGEPVEVSFSVDGIELTVRAEVVRWGVAPGGVTIVFRFTDLPRGDADRLRRFVFRQELAVEEPDEPQRRVLRHPRHEPGPLVSVDAGLPAAATSTSPRPPCATWRRWRSPAWR